ncbi:MAG: hypothetical protein M1835_007381 [Candelina submexicana]|nr:MAG: hypothetical protein M1835_007381 [Candelina submexicana]
MSLSGLISALVLAAGITASPTGLLHRQANNTGTSTATGGPLQCPPGFRNVVFNTVAPGQANWQQRFQNVMSAGVTNWIGFSVTPISQNQNYGKPSFSPDSNQIPLIMSPDDISYATNNILNQNGAVVGVFNEPDFSYLGVTYKNDAAPLAKIAKPFFDAAMDKSTMLLSPALAFTSSGYLEEFYANCAGCEARTSIISIHIYNANPDAAIGLIQGVRAKHPTKDIWITELAPASSPHQDSTNSGGSVCNLSAAETQAWMVKVLTFAAKSGYVKKVFWNTGEWSPDFGDQCNPSLTDATGALTPLANVYKGICA